LKSCNVKIYVNASRKSLFQVHFKRKIYKPIAAIRPCPFLPECYHYRNPAITFPGTF
jgi:hypothetical protein